jgi:hypothetical protein
MTTPHKILTILADSRATTAAIAETCRVPLLVVESMLHRHAKDALVVAVPDPTLDLWDLTPDGREKAESLQPQHA